jgi:uncharacterized phage-associated protein
MDSPLAIANFFIKKYFDTGIVVTPMKAIKLAYIAHGWHLGLYDEELLDEAVHAWKYGPVVDTIYEEFKKYGASPIKELYKDYKCDEYPMPAENKITFLNSIWEAYSKYDGIALSAMTHQPNTPWYIVWNVQGGKDQKHAIIPNDLIKSHYKEKISQVNGRQTA